MKTRVDSFDLPDCPNCGDTLRECDIEQGSFTFNCGSIWHDELDEEGDYSGYQVQTRVCRQNRPTVEQLESELPAPTHTDLMVPPETIVVDRPLIPGPYIGDEAKVFPTH